MIGMLSAFIALFTKQYILGMIILIYCQIQLAEAIIWHGIDTDNNSLNHLGTNYAKYTLPLHLFFAGLGIAIMTYKNGSINIIPLIIGIVFYIGILYYYTMSSSIKTHINNGEKGLSFPSNRACMKRECQNNENRLQWPFKDSYYIYQTLLIYILLFIFLPLKNSLTLFLFFSLTYIISRLMYKWSAASIWCFLSAVLAPVIVFVNYKI
jgi:hypothetical protein